MSQPINISASRGAAILGLSEYKTPVQIWLEICESRHPGFCVERGYKLSITEQNAPMRWGSAFESAIIDLAENKTDLDPKFERIQNKEEFFKHKKYDFITCHVDGIYNRKSGHDPIILHEGKTTSIFAYREKWGEPGTDKIPSEYMVQVQHQLLCTGADKCIVSVLVFPDSVDNFEKMGLKLENVDTFNWARVISQMGYFHQYTVTADKSLHKKLLKKYSDFWNFYVLTETEPPIKTDEDIRLLCPEPKGTIIIPEEIENWIKEYKNINQEIGASGNLAKRKEQIKVNILAYLKSYSGMIKVPVDKESEKKWVIKNQTGDNCASFDGKTFRASKGE